MKHFFHSFISQPKRLLFRAQQMEVIGFPNDSAIKLLGQQYLGMNPAHLDKLANPGSILNAPLKSDAITVRQLVIQRGIQMGANRILSDTFGARKINDPDIYNRVVDGQIAIVRSTLEQLAEKGLLPNSFETFNGGAWFGPFENCYTFKPEESDMEPMLRLHIRQAKAAVRNNVEPQFEAVSSVRQAQAIAMACREVGITSPWINFVVCHEGNLAADKASFHTGIAAVRDILPQTKIGLNCCRVIGAENTLTTDIGPYGSFYPNASQLKDAWDLEEGEGNYNDIDEPLAVRIIALAKQKGFQRVGICCGADERSLRLIAEANKKAIDRALALRH